MVPLLVPEVFPPVDFSMQAHMFFGDAWHHPYISTYFCGKRFYFPLHIYNHVCICVLLVIYVIRASLVKDFNSMHILESIRWIDE